ncbi:PREDICTED: uncharacterized protein LOC109191555 [Ipomoea nil]|uniref:uncharacterized protein LOC109191555 n=1 Tax=Ipomoea nil TaxID=35883 RepID=UPI0009017C03|nr:PREDICTED: uncharacterized protein LOC109191555 [Ipomoea nil]
MQLSDIAAQLDKLKIKLPDSFVVHFALNTLPPEYSTFKIAYNTHDKKWSINDLINKCVQEEGRLRQEQKGENVMLAIAKPKGRSGKRHTTAKGKAKISPQTDIKKTQKCFFCKKKGHMKKDCAKFKKWMSEKGYAKSETTDVK